MDLDLSAYTNFPLHRETNRWPNDFPEYVVCNNYFGHCVRASGDRKRGPACRGLSARRQRLKKAISHESWPDPPTHNMIDTGDTPDVSPLLCSILYAIRWQKITTENPSTPQAMEVARFCNLGVWVFVKGQSFGFWPISRFFPGQKEFFSISFVGMCKFDFMRFLSKLQCDLYACRM